MRRSIVSSLSVCVGTHPRSPTRSVAQLKVFPNEKSSAASKDSSCARSIDYSPAQVPRTLCCGPPAKLDNYRSINALAEAVNGLYKAELIRKDGPWRSLEQ